MIRKILSVDPRKTGPLDFALMGLTSCLAIYSICQSIGSDPDAIFFIALTTVGTTLSFFASRLPRKNPVLRMNGYIYAAVVFLTLFFAAQLNNLLPENLFEDRALIGAGFLCWMMAIGSFCTWRDNTLLFQAVPATALFGLVGTFDIYKGATFLFFIFLLCLATFMARAHGRMMIRRAEASGYHGIDRLNEGPWRWMAGPGWALASAAAIVLVSLVAAPLLQEQAVNLGIAGHVRFPQPRGKMPELPALFNADSTGSVQIGQGPLSLTQTPVLIVEMPGKHYLKSQAYYDYTGHGWRTPGDPAVGVALETYKGKTLWGLSQNAIDNPEQFRFTVDMLTPLPFVPVPGEVTDLSNAYSSFRRWDGTYSSLAGGRSPVFTGLALAPSPGARPQQAISNLDPTFNFITSDANIPQSVRDLARNVTKDARTDFDRVQAIEAEIDRRCKYNLKARPTPSDADPVEYFLFTSHEGYCDLFASAMATMCRAIHLPVRYVTGYYPIDPPVSQNRYTITESEGHAWAEVFFEGSGWVPVDATEGAAEVPGGELGKSTEEPWYAAAWFKLLVLPAAALGLGYGLVLLLLRARDARLVVRPRREVARAYAKFERVIQPAVGHPRRLSQTASEYLGLGRHRLGRLYPSAQRLNREFELLLYGLEEPTESAVVRLRTEVAQFRTAVRHQKDIHRGRKSA